ncbi:hypothetical protein [Corynebacterium halotolerans]|uniref:hypothetical protein n=1 Tax=Corynebacterium halotolerans TaxID=225326 RepID=UPI003CF2E47E
MALLVLRCGLDDTPGDTLDAATVEEILTRRQLDSTKLSVHDLSAVPTRRELRFLDDTAKEILPVDPTPSLDEISARPDVEHLGAPKRAPQQPPEALRVIVVGTDAALSAVLTRMMRADYLWAEVGYVPVEQDSPAATNWGLPTDPAAALEVAVAGPVKPVPLIRTDAGLAVAGSATISAWDGGELTGEIIVDDAILTRHEAREGIRFHGVFGARLVPMTDAPGIAAVRATGPVQSVAGTGSGFGGWLARRYSPEQLQKMAASPLFRSALAKTPAPHGGVAPESLKSGRAVQAGGPELAVTVDGVRAKRPAERSTFYRHLRDLQIVRL